MQALALIWFQTFQMSRKVLYGVRRNKKDIDCISMIFPFYNLFLKFLFIFYFLFFFWAPQS